MSLNLKPRKYKAAIPEESIPEVPTESDSSDEEHGTVRTHRWTKRPRLSVVSEANPSPRVSAFEVPNPAFLRLPRDKKSESDQKKALIRRIVGTLLVVITIILLIIVIYMVSETPETYDCKYSDSDYITPRDLDNPEVLDDLTPEEYEAIKDYMMHIKNLNLIRFQSATVNSSYIYMIDLFLPNKDQIIQYLDNGSKRPTREAIVTVVRGDIVPPVVEEYIVSSASFPETHRLYKNPSYKHNPIPYTSRPIDGVDRKFLFSVIVNKVTEELFPLLIESYGLCYHNCTKDVNCLKIYITAPQGLYSKDRKSWAILFPDIDGYYIHPLGLKFLIDHSSTDTNKWQIVQIIYNDKKFGTTSALMDAYHSKSLKLIHFNHVRDEKLYSSYEARGNLPEYPAQGPRLTEPNGKRFKVEGQRVSYNKWTFRYHMRPTTGMQVLDVKFDGVRIAYEISLQEVLVLYSGFEPAQSTTNYYDVSRLIGASSMELVRGVDCPDTAVYLDTFFLANAERAKRYKNNVCLFENNGGLPMRRHYQDSHDDGYNFYGGIVDYHFIIRTIATIWNYDYIIDYMFYNNGAIKVKVSISGYVQATVWLNNKDPYTNPIRDNLMSDLHVHLFNYKVDLDIVGPTNRYTVNNIEAETKPHPWYPNLNITKLHVNPELIITETKAATAFKPNTPQYHIFHNNNAKSQYGSDRGYRLLINSPIVCPLSNNPKTAEAKWTNYSLFVTKRKESERESSSIFSPNGPFDPFINIKDFIDGENLVDEDLVAWIKIGAYHIPGTEDVPSTPTTWNYFSFQLIPYNYFSECPSLNSADNVLIRPPERDKKRANVETYGRSFESKCIPLSVGPYNYDGIRR